ncbi:TRAP transporter small permease [Entomohabitans teleogrylli]|uniref:TRAP transporter small permease n=1 Tax=Entomohabitans teleogrylli TaxID=1384589 RepID=UPI00073DA18D|nr:TRAP transporter small permease [Entomohabitans teleogrylli]
MRLLGKAADIAAVMTLLVLVVMTTIGVIMRYCLNTPLQWSEEMSGLLMIWVVMLGGIVAERDRVHLSIPFVVDALPTAARRLAQALISLISAGLLVAVAWLAWKLAQGTAFKVTQILKISWFWIDIAVTVGALGIACLSLWRLFSGSHRGEKP